MNSPEFQKNVIKNKFQQFVDGMIYLNKHNRSLYPDEVKHLGTVRYLRDMGTVDVNIGRAVGKTTYILESATENDLIICVNNTRKKDILHKTVAKVMTYEDAAHAGFIRFSGLTNSYSTIYLDDFSCFGVRYGEYGDNEKFYIDLIENLVVRRLLTEDSTIVRLG